MRPVFWSAITCAITPIGSSLKVLPAILVSLIVSVWLALELLRCATKLLYKLFAQIRVLLCSLDIIISRSAFTTFPIKATHLTMYVVKHLFVCHFVMSGVRSVLIASHSASYVRSFHLCDWHII